ncbi:hypothetical protein GE061_017606 [Apolygus lucorum]|uniref:Aminopeptidase n=1 Tax=Apolygus lucorum TaxID=248454 RepID=A0A6A4J3K8_APOLU|nr:hypothetical protein GE061_017606 [Apolygus lucorum]
MRLRRSPWRVHPSRDVEEVTPVGPRGREGGRAHSEFAIRGAAYSSLGALRDRNIRLSSSTSPKMIWIALVVALSMSVTAKEHPSYRLPEHLKPTHYRLDLITDLDKFKFSGEVWIKINCLKTTSTITLHSVDLDIDQSAVMVKEIGLESTDGEPIKIIEQKAVPKHEFHTIKLEQNMKSGRKYLVYLAYTGNLEPSLSGYYRSSYLDRKSNSTRWLGVTQFEPSDARRAFPCFDEPGMKAKFSIRLAHKDSLSSVSNMPLVKTIPMKNRKGWSWDEFQESVPMSTYLVAWMVSDFSHGDAPLRPNNVKFRIWARSDAMNQIGLASDVGPRILEFYEQLFDVKYPLPKQDMAAIPDFSAGAMENWGLITYRETELLYDDKAPSVYAQERVAYVVAHELAHQWFGNLVTMKWWTDLWLNEGFATYIGTLGVHNVLPELNYLNEQSMNYIETVYALDSLKSSHQISIPVGPPSEVNEIFDAISYKKGATIIRMMHNFLGDSFKLGVTKYLRTHKFGNAEQDDLWSALTEQAHMDGVLPQEMTVKEIMDSWTLQTGHPILYVERDYSTGKAYVSQSRFLMIPPAMDEVVNETCWWFPLTYTTQSASDFNSSATRDWLRCGQERVPLNNLQIREDEWLLVNVELTALARVMYDTNNWDLIIKTLNTPQYKSIGTLNRAGLLIDAFDLANRGDLSYETALQMASYLSQETEFIPLSKGLGGLGYIGGMLHRTPNYGIYKKYMKTILTPFFGKYGKLSEIPKGNDEIKKHILLSRKFCHFDVGDCSTQAKKLYNLWAAADLDTNNPIPADLQPMVLCTAVRYGTETTWDEVYDRYLKSNVASEKSLLLRALGCSREVWILQRYMAWSIDAKSTIRKQDSISVFAYVANSDDGFYLAFDFLQRNLKAISKYHQPRNDKVGRYFKNIAKGVMSQDEMERLRSLYELNAELFEGSKLAVQQGLENAALNIKWHADNYEKISAMLSK